MDGSIVVDRSSIDRAKKVIAGYFDSEARIQVEPQKMKLRLGVAVFYQNRAHAVFVEGPKINQDESFHLMGKALKNWFDSR